MELRFEPVKAQKFDIGRTINFSKCDCEKCDFMHCPKHNYAVKMKKARNSFSEFWQENGENILAHNFIKIIDTNFPGKYRLHLLYEDVENMMDCLSFPKGTYWDVNKHTFDDTVSEINIQKCSRSGNIVTLGRIDIDGMYLNDYDLSQAQNKLCNKMLSFMADIKTKIIENCIEENYNPLIGWLSPTGKHYVCESTQHIELARRLGMTEFDSTALKELHDFIDKWNEKYKLSYFEEANIVVLLESVEDSDEKVQ